jgi:hypothetical protein
VFITESTGTNMSEGGGYLFPKDVEVNMLNSDDFVFYFMIEDQGPYEVFDPYDEVTKFID